MAKRLKAIEFTLKCANLALIQPVAANELKVIVVPYHDVADRFEVTIKYDQLSNLTQSIRLAARQLVPYWWCSVIQLKNVYLDEVDDLTQYFKSGNVYTVSISPLPSFPTDFAPQSSLRSSHDSQHTDDHSHLDFENNENIVLGRVKMALLAGLKYNDFYRNENAFQDILTYVNEKIKKVNEQVLKDELYPLYGEPVCFTNDTKSLSQDWAKSFKLFFTKVMNSSRIYCILTGNEKTGDTSGASGDPNETGTRVVYRNKGASYVKKLTLDEKVYEKMVQALEHDFVSIGHIVKKNPISHAALLWLLHDMIWGDLSKNDFISVNDFRNIIPLSSLLEDEFDAYLWCFCPRYIGGDNLDSDDVLMTQNEFIWDIYEGFAPGGDKLFIRAFLKNTKKKEWQDRVANWFGYAKTFHRAIGLQAFAALKFWVCDVMTHPVAIAWMEFFNASPTQKLQDSSQSQNDKNQISIKPVDKEPFIPKTIEMALKELETSINLADKLPVGAVKGVMYFRSLKTGTGSMKCGILMVKSDGSWSLPIAIEKKDRKSGSQEDFKGILLLTDVKNVKDFSTGKFAALIIDGNAILGLGDKGNVKDQKIEIADWHTKNVEFYGRSFRKSEILVTSSKMNESDIVKSMHDKLDCITKFVSCLERYESSAQDKMLNK